MLGDLVRTVQKEREQVQPSRRLYEGLRKNWLQSQKITFDLKEAEQAMPFRVSALSTLCPRLVALARRQPVMEIFGSTELWAFALGRAYHTAMQQALAEMQESPLRGWWQQESHEVVSTAIDVATQDMLEQKTFVIRKGPQGMPCARPEGKFWQYREMSLVDRALGVSGHPDGVLWWPERKELLEIKSIHSMQADRVNPAEGGFPLEAHILQAQGYLYLLGYEWARIIYLIKTSEDLGLIMFEHEVQRDEAMIDGLKTLWQRCADARNLDALDPLPDRLAACMKASAHRAQRCPAMARKRCFSAL